MKTHSANFSAENLRKIWLFIRIWYLREYNKSMIPAFMFVRDRYVMRKILEYSSSHSQVFAMMLQAVEISSLSFIIILLSHI